ncbi:ABC transporter A, ABCA, partial [Kipferlia bialata]
IAVGQAILGSALIVGLLCLVPQIGFFTMVLRSANYYIVHNESMPLSYLFSVDVDFGLLQAWLPALLTGFIYLYILYQVDNTVINFSGKFAWTRKKRDRLLRGDESDEAQGVFSQRLGGDSDVVEMEAAARDCVCDARDGNVEVVPPVAVSRISKVFHSKVELATALKDQKTVEKRKESDQEDILAASDRVAEARAGHVAVRGVSLVVQPGEVLGLLGANGAGKTTTINLLTGRMAVDAGELFVAGVDVKRERSKLFSRIGLCPQDNDHLYDLLSVEDHLRVYAGIKGLTGSALDAEVDRVVDVMEMDEYRTSNAKTLSGGWKRRLCVGIACIAAPKIMFLDEPSSGMDPVTRQHLWRLVRELSHGTAIVLTTHSMDEAEALCN